MLVKTKYGEAPEHTAAMGRVLDMVPKCPNQICCPCQKHCRKGVSVLDMSASLPLLGGSMYGMAAEPGVSRYHKEGSQIDVPRSARRMSLLEAIVVVGEMMTRAAVRAR